MQVTRLGAKVNVDYHIESDGHYYSSVDASLAVIYHRERHQPPSRAAVS
jgi:hypothetical protein